MSARPRLQEVELPASGFTSPRLGISFLRDAQRLIVRAPDGRPFRAFAELKAERDAIATERDAAAQRAEAAEQRAARLTERMRELGLDPDDV